MTVTGVMCVDNMTRCTYRYMYMYMCTVNTTAGNLSSLPATLLIFKCSLSKVKKIHSTMEQALKLPIFDTPSYM